MRLKVYYIDDEPDLLEMFSELFSAEGIEILTFVDPLEGIAKIKECPPDLLFIDYRLPGSTGDKIARQLDPRIPKVLVSGDLNVPHDDFYVAVLAKPFNTEAVEELIRRIAQQRKTA